MKKLLLGSAFFLFLLATRFFYSSQITPSLTHDEMIYAANASSLAHLGRAFSQDVGWFALKPVHHMYAEWTASLMAPFFWLIKSPILAAHALTGVMSATLPFIFGWFIYGIFKDKKLAVIATILMSTSPLLIQFSKLAYDSFFALYFYLLGGAVFLNIKSKWRYLSIALLTIGFFNYQGYKLVLLPWTLLLSIIAGFKKTWILPSFGLLLTLWYGFILLPQTPASERLSQTIFSDTSKIEAITQSRRSTSLMPQLGTYFSNDILSSIELGVDNFLGSIDPKMLFLRGEPSASGFALYSHGFFFWMDALLLIVGMIVMLGNKKTSKHGYLYLGLVGIALTPAVLSTISHWYLLRSLLFYCLLYGIISFGAKAIWEAKIGKFALIVGYTVSLSFFTYQYFYQYPIARADASEFHERLVVEYGVRSQKDIPIIVYDDEPLYLAMSHLFYTNSFSRMTFSTDNVLYTNVCQTEGAKSTIITSVLFDPCEKVVRTENASIVSLIDSGKKYTITNDYVCGNVDLGRYIRMSKLSDFNDLQSNTEQFCSHFIVNQVL